MVFIVRCRYYMPNKLKYSNGYYSIWFSPRRHYTETTILDRYISFIFLNSILSKINFIFHVFNMHFYINCEIEFIEEYKRKYTRSRDEQIL